jgi:iron(III) transport system ATP-binding protein
MTLILRDISHRFGDVAAVDGAFLEASAGEIISLFGHSGCGKTTLLRIAAGLEPMQTGEVEIDGEVIAKAGSETPPEKRPIGFVFQDYVLFPHMTVEKNVAFGLAGEPDAAARVAEQLNAFGLDILAGRYPHELSGGQQQRVALARALARKPKAILLDEPFASIDATLRRRLREDLRRMLKEQNAAVILVTHDPEEALTLGDRVALMRAGRIIETASPQELFETPKTPEGAAIFPGCQTLEGMIVEERLETLAGEFPAKGIDDGPGIAILREGALSAFPDPAGAFQVADVRFAGPGWSAWLKGRKDPVRLRVGFDEPPAKGEIMTIAADLSGIFVFRNQ